MDTEKQYIKFSTAQVIFLAAAVGIIVSNMFYIQPIEKIIATDLQISSAKIAVLAMLAQVSYAVGLLLLVPLGDLFNRYRFLQLMELSSILALLLAFIAPNAITLGIAIVLIGLTSIGGQIIIPYVAYLTPIKQQGPILGAMISGMLTGVLFARTFSGVIASILGWRAVYGLAAVLNIILLIAIHFIVPDDPRKQVDERSYGKIIATLPRLFVQYRYLRGSALNAFAMFGLANLLWASLAFMLQKYFGYGSAVAGSMGLLGIVSIFAAPVIGRMVNKYSPQFNIKLSWLFGLLAYIIFGLFLRNIWFIMLGIIILDLSTQFSQVTNQAIIQSLNRKTNSRNNSIFMFSYFLGGSVGTLVGINAWNLWNWAGVTGAAVVFLLIALVGYFRLGVPRKLG